MPPLSTQRLIELEAELARAAADRHAEASRIEARRRQALQEADERRDRRRREVEQAHLQRRDSFDGQTEGRRAMLTASHDAERVRTQEEYQARRTKAEAEASDAIRRAAEEQKSVAWEIHTVYEVERKKPPQKRAAARRRLAELRSGLAVVAAEANAIARERGHRGADFELGPEPPAPPPDQRPATDSACQAAEQSAALAVEAAREAAQALYDQPLPRSMAGVLPAGVFAAALVVLAPLLGVLLGWADWRAYAGAVGGAVVTAAAVYLSLRPKALAQTRESYEAARERLSAAEGTIAEAVALAESRCDRELRELRERRDADRRALEARVAELVEEAGAKRQRVLHEIREYYPTKLSQMRTDHQAALDEIAREESRQSAEATRQRDQTLAQIEAEHTAQRESADAQHDAAWQAMFRRWLTRYDDLRAELRDLRSECSRLFPDFATVAYGAGPAADGDPSTWTPPTAPPGAIEFGTSCFDLERIEHGLSADERLHPPEPRLRVPALWTLAEQPNFLITASGEGRAHAVALLRAVMLRVLTAMPPGRVRFTLIDPVGLGDNFQSFMHLADADEQLIGGRIWSQSRDIDEQLSRLTTHMETVLQKYLRSEYETIHDYNAEAGEVAEPLQVLVIAGFPTNFTEAAAKRLVSLATGGPRCGVHTLLSVDSAARLPSDFRLDDIKEHSLWLEWRPDSDGPAFEWRQPPLPHWPLTVAQEPPPDRMIDAIRRAGQAAKAAIRVEVPFSAVEPPAEELWGGDCAVELCVPIGRAGARKLQHVRLGRGTSQHLLVAGKTGSGKSTFLHALVTSAAMRFAPDQVEFYLIDFKKGVEFKSYATHRLPHARVIAIESEREFGLSVLERLDEELSARGEKFRSAGVQNLADYRDARPDDPAPRVLLVIDEFQELFVADDRLAQEASLLLDRLVRQGRAFGMHVVLGTQTLAGAYSIARSTLGQIAVRVALECGEADAHLILSDERNNAARFLSRPGEAIYNAQNGMLSANEPFQVVWLPDAQRAAKLDKVDEQRHRTGRPRPETIVFEGSAPADPRENAPLAAALAGDPPPRPAGSPPPAWLGASVAIKPPAAVHFGRHPGANLLCVGADESAALGMLSTAAISLAAAEPAARFLVLDATRPGEEAAGVWAAVLGSLPCEGRLVDLAGVGAAMTELAGLVAEREKAAEDPSSPVPPRVYVVLHNAGRFRELRKRDDDFGFGMSSDEPKKPDAILADVLRNGPPLGIHVLVWCDSYNSATRVFDRQAMREFALRVAMQMSAADSSHLIDSPAASDLNLHRALLYNDETGQTEKFRPYAAPTAAWLAEVGQSTRQHAG
ncbi:FtsK/SpoIIIE domain-containing protein [Botrimarina sp.]|uniref:FtsK/SpoIIIE domain-containing protein n=1 Tax=Botrimarina sp. TaxID=2795802 RepID=UPI0032EE09E0